MSRTIAILTDFGTRDTYVGVMKGVIRRIAPDASLIDLSHEVEPQNVHQAAFMLLNSYTYFPDGTVFLLVVDPGVGTSRQPIAVTARGYDFVAPDNGVLTYVLAQIGDYVAHCLSNELYQLADTSQTFHGRDIFAPAAAYLAAGTPIQDFGRKLESLIEFPASAIEISTNEIMGEVIYVDHFGNIITNIGWFKRGDTDKLVLTPALGLGNCELSSSKATIVIGETEIKGISSTYGEVAPGEVLALIGSSGFLEIAINQGNAAKVLDVKPHTQVRLKLGD